MPPEQSPPAEPWRASEVAARRNSTRCGPLLNRSAGSLSGSARRSGGWLPERGSHLPSARPVGSTCSGLVAGVSARRVTVPLIEKSRSWAGPTASSLAGAARVGTGSEAASTVWSCACAGTARKTASATAAELMRNACFISPFDLAGVAWRFSAATPALCRPFARTSSTGMMNGSRLGAKNRRNAIFSARPLGRAPHLPRL